MSESSQLFADLDDSSHRSLLNDSAVVGKDLSIRQRNPVFWMWMSNSKCVDISCFLITNRFFGKFVVQAQSIIAGNSDKMSLNVILGLQVNVPR